MPPSQQKWLEEEHLCSLSEDKLKNIYNEIVDTLPSKSPIYLPTEKVGLIDRIIGISNVRQIYTNDLDKIYRPKLKELRRKYKNYSRCFLIGNGPSLNKTDLDALKDEITFAVNGFFLKCKDLAWLPTFYLVEDHLVAEDRAHWINKLKGTIKLFPAYLGYAFPKSDDTIFYNHRPRKSYPHGYDFSLEADKITYTGCTVTFSMMQIAAYLGFKEINLVGVDACYEMPADVEQRDQYGVGVLDMKSEDTNHFDPCYFGRGYRWHDPQVNKMIEAYREAKSTLAATGQTIYNATIGGHLEVFERRSFNSIFPKSLRPSIVYDRNKNLNLSKFPKILILDMTCIGSNSATGQVKEALFSGWASNRIMQISSAGKDRFQLTTSTDLGKFITSPIEEHKAREKIIDFSPDLIIYRPVPDVIWLHRFSMQIIKDLDIPLITWIMDDWPQMLAKRDGEESKTMIVDLIFLLRKSKLRFSICDSMSQAFEKRYGAKFLPFANGVDPVEWPALRHHENNSLLIRYAGGLAENMGLESLKRISRVVEDLTNNGHQIVFEINTQYWWYKKFASHFSDFNHTAIEAECRTPEEYRIWLSEGDISVIAYNFDEKSIDYVRYSMANKMPELLASGAVIFAHGPQEVATIKYLTSLKCAVIVDQDSDYAVASELIKIANNPARRNQLSRNARELAFERHNIIDLREKIRSVISSCIKSGYIGGISPGSSCSVDLKDINEMLREGCYSEALKYYIQKWQALDDLNCPLANAYAFNAVYAYRKLSNSSDNISISDIASNVLKQSK